MNPLPFLPILAAIPEATGTPALDVWAQWGLAGIVIAFTMYRDAKREARLSAALERNETFVREKLSSLVEAVISATNYCRGRNRVDDN